MRLSVVKSRLLALAVGLVVLIIALLPFHAILTVWAGSNFGHYTAFRLWKEYLLVVVGLIAIAIVIKNAQIRNIVFKNKLVWLIVTYAGLDIIVTLVAHSKHLVSGKALAYGLLDDLRFLFFFVVCYVLSLKSKSLSSGWQKLILIPATLVVLFGLIQMFILPANFLTHFGYGVHTIMPFETVNQNSSYIRIMSTLRGANPLGAYLILPISALIVLLIKYPKSWNWAKALLLLGSILVLFGSYSRSALIGAVLASLFICLSYLKKDWLIKHRLYLIASSLALIAVLVIGLLVLGHSAKFQNIVFHTQTNSSAPLSSDQAHLSAVIGGFSQVVSYPLGKGAGTSGPGSFYNKDLPTRIPENYFLQVGEEAGWLGLVLFILINVLVGYELWQRRTSALALTLLGSLVGLSIVNLLLLAWTDDTISYIWWGLAGVAMSLSPLTKTVKDNIA